MLERGGDRHSKRVTGWGKKTPNKKKRQSNKKSYKGRDVKEKFKINVRERERNEKNILANLVRKRLTKWEWKPHKESERVEECLIKRVRVWKWLIKRGTKRMLHKERCRVREWQRVEQSERMLHVERNIVRGCLKKRGTECENAS